MANRRMFSRDVTDSDQFLDLSIPAQALYFHLGMAADDDGLISSARRIARCIGVAEDALGELIEKGFLIDFPEGGIYAISHFLVNNTIKSDRYKPTIFQAQLALLSKGANNTYFRSNQIGNKLEPERKQTGTRTEPECVQDDSADQSGDLNIEYGIINQITDQLLEKGATKQEIDWAIEHCRGIEMGNPVAYLMKTIENRRRSPGKTTLSTTAHNFPERDYSDVDAEIMKELAREMKVFKETGTVSA